MIFPVKKPKPRAKAGRQPLKRRRMRKYNLKRGGSMFPHKRDLGLRAFIRAQPCELWDEALALAISPHDIAPGLAWAGFRHRCWGRIGSAHVGQHQGAGAPDAGRLIPLCKAAHDYYDEHRVSFLRITGTSEEWLTFRAEGYTLRYVESGGVLVGER